MKKAKRINVYNRILLFIFQMSQPQKRFIKYQFDDPGPRVRQQRRKSRQNFKERDVNAQTRGRRNVSYTEKASSARQNVLKDMISTFIPIKKASPKIAQLMKSFPRFFSETPRQPEPFTPQSLNGHLAFMGKKILERQARQFAPIEDKSESDPNWDSDSDVEGGIESKKIDETIVEKAKEKLTSIKQLRQDELKRHERDFLQDYYRQKHQQELQNSQKEQQVAQSPTQNHTATEEKPTSSDQIPDNEWTEYQQKQVNDFVNLGIIEKIEQDSNEFGDDDFSVGDEKSQEQKSVESSSSDGDDDIFGDEGPTRIVKVKAETDEQIQQRMGKVVINNHLFSRIAESVGIPPGACIWIVRNKTQRYKVSTQFMDEMYRLNNFCQSLPYVSLNHSEFVHNNDVEKEKGLQIFKKFNARKHQTGHGQGNLHHKIQNRNYQNKPKFQQYKPNPQQPILKTHLNKK